MSLLLLQHKRQLEIAWAAGLFEGEGCAYVQITDGRPYARLLLGMGDEDVVKRFAEIVRCGNITLDSSANSKNPKHNVAYRWTMCKRADVKRIIVMFYPYMGARRRAKLDELLLLCQ